MARHAHELAAAGEPRWEARLDKDLVMVKDLASGEEVQATAYTTDGDTLSFALPGEGLRHLRLGESGYDAFRAVLDKSALKAESEALAVKPAPKGSSKPATEKPAA